MSIKDNVRAYEESQARAALEAHGWRIEHAARELGIATSSLQRLLGRHPKLEAERQAAIAARNGRVVE